VSIHSPARPAWTCTVCADTWPCATRQRELLGEFDGARVSLTLYLAELFLDACADLPAAPAGALHQRFLGWVPPKH
jgi:hypothetical protein